MTIGQLVYGLVVTLAGLFVVCVLSLIIGMTLKQDGDDDDKL